MPTFDDAADTPAAARGGVEGALRPRPLPQWWAGVETVEPGATGQFTMYPDGYPDFPMPQTMQTDPRGRARDRLLPGLRPRVRVAAEEQPDGGTRIAVHVEIPEAEAHRLDGQRAAIQESLMRLAALSATA